MEIHNYIKYYLHAYMREVLGETVHSFITFLLILLGVILLAVSIADSNLLLGNPANRDRTLSRLEYKKTRQKLRIVLGIIGVFLIAYNLLGIF